MRQDLHIWISPFRESNFDSICKGSSTNVCMYYRTYIPTNHPPPTTHAISLYCANFEPANFEKKQRIYKSQRTVKWCKYISIRLWVHFRPRPNRYILIPTYTFEVVHVSSDLLTSLQFPWS